MGRRTLKNLDNRILKKVIQHGAEKGVDSISTKKVAINLKITEPTIYVHFQTKANLLKEAYLRAFEMSYGPAIKANEGIREADASILPLIRQAKEYPDEYIYLSNYIHENMCDYSDPEDPVRAIRTSVAIAMGVNSLEECNVYDNLLIDVGLRAIDSFTKAAIAGDLNDDEETARLLAVFLKYGLRKAKEEADAHPMK